MASTADVLNSVLNLGEEQFFATDSSALSRREATLLDTDFTGVAINAPRVIPIARRATLPLFVALRSDGRRGWDVPLRDNAVLVGVNIDDGSVRLANALETEKERSNRGGRAPRARGEPANLAAVSAVVTTLDAREQLGIEWTTSTWSLALLHFDWPSNLVSVSLQGDRRQVPAAAPSVSPAPNPACGSSADALPCYSVAELGSAAGGASFALALVPGAAPRLEARGSFALRLRARQVARPGIVHSFAGGRRENVAAIVPITLALVGLDSGEPIQFDWAVPIYGPPAQVGARVAGAFAIDALAGGNVELPPGRYAAYLIFDETIVGPRPLEVPAN
jgi:hypothetical protein